MKETKAVLVDIDGTLVTTTEFDFNLFEIKDGEDKDARQKRISDYLADWNKRTMNARVLIGGVEKLHEFKAMGYDLVFLTARGQSCRVYTRMKFKKMGITHLVDSIWHRPLKYEGVSSSLYKEKMIKMLIKKGYKFEWAMDDEEKNLKVMASFGMKVIDAKSWH